MHITNREDLRVGDIATFAYYDHEFTGRLWGDREGTLFVGSTTVRYANGRWFTDFDFIDGTREAPALPTEPGSVILVTECRGERVNEPVPAVLSSAGRWWTHGRMFDDHAGHLPEHISAWEPAKVVAA